MIGSYKLLFKGPGSVHLSETQSFPDPFEQDERTEERVEPYLIDSSKFHNKARLFSVGYRLSCL